MKHRVNWKKLIFIAPLAIAGIALVTLLAGQIVRLLWNALLPPLCRILFGGQGGGRSGMRRGLADRFDAMTPEERARFRARIRERFGLRPDTPPAAP